MVKRWVEGSSGAVATMAWPAAPAALINETYNYVTDIIAPNNVDELCNNSVIREAKSIHYWSNYLHHIYYEIQKT